MRHEGHPPRPYVGVLPPDRPPCGLRLASDPSLFTRSSQNLAKIRKRSKPCPKNPPREYENTAKTKKKTEDAKLAGLSQPAARRSLKQALELLHESGLPVPTFEEIAAETPSDCALAIQRILAATVQAQGIAIRRGELIPETRFREIVGDILTLVRANIRCTFPALAATEAEASAADPALFRKIAERIGSRLIAAIDRELSKIQATLPDD